MLFVRKASDETYYSFNESTKSVESLFKAYPVGFVISDNFWYNESTHDIKQAFYKMSDEDAEKATKCKLELLIYDTYIE